MVSSDIAVAGRCGAVAEGHGRAHHIQAPCGWRWFDGNCLQAQTSALGRQETRETRKMKITRRDLLRSASATWATTILSKPASAAAEFEFKLGVNTPDTHPLTLRLIEAAHAIGAQSSGRLNVTVFPTSQLGGDPEMLSQLRAGGIELLAAPSMTLSTLVQLSGLPSIGFAFQSYDQVWAAMDGEVGDIVRDAIGKAGLTPMKRIWDNGFRQI